MCISRSITKAAMKLLLFLFFLFLRLINVIVYIVTKPRTVVLPLGNSKFLGAESFAQHCHVVLHPSDC